MPGAAPVPNGKFGFEKVSLLYTPTDTDGGGGEYSFHSKLEFSTPARSSTVSSPANTSLPSVFDTAGETVDLKVPVYASYFH